MGVRPVGAVELGAAKFRPGENGERQGGARQVCPLEAAADHVGLDQAGALEVRLGKHCARHAGPGQVGLDEACSGEISPEKFDGIEVCLV